MQACVLGSGVDGTTPCLLVEHGGWRLLLNATEGLQRLAGEHRLKLHRGLDAVVLCSLEPIAVAGLPGVLLTLAQAGVARLRVYGPPGTAAFLQTLRPFTRIGEGAGRLQLETSELEGDACLVWRERLRLIVLPMAAAHEQHDAAAATDQPDAIWLSGGAQTLPMGNDEEIDIDDDDDEKPVVKRQRLDAPHDDSLKRLEAELADSDHSEEIDREDQREQEGGDGDGDGDGESESESESSGDSDSDASDDASSESSSESSSDDSDSEDGNRRGGGGGGRGGGVGGGGGAPPDFGSEGLFDEMLSSRPISGLLQRRARQDDALRARLVEQWWRAKYGGGGGGSASGGGSAGGGGGIGSGGGGNVAAAAPVAVRLEALPPGRRPLPHLIRGGCRRMSLLIEGYGTSAAAGRDDGAPAGGGELLFCTCENVEERAQLAAARALSPYFVGSEEAIGSPGGHPNSAHGHPMAPAPLPLRWVVHAVPSSLAASVCHRRWAARCGGGDARHVLLRADVLPSPSHGAGHDDAAFVASATQRSMLSHVLGPRLFPAQGGIEGGGGCGDDGNGRDDATTQEDMAVAAAWDGDCREVRFVQARPLLRLEMGPHAGRKEGEGADYDEGEIEDGCDWSGCVSLVDDADLGREVCSILDSSPGLDSDAATAAATAAAAPAATAATTSATAAAAAAATPPPHAMWPWTAPPQPPPSLLPQPPRAPPPPPGAPAAHPPGWSPGWSRRELQVCMLGTGCAVPSKHRAPAAIYLDLFSRGGILLDCGEGTLGQLHRLLGAAGVARALATLRCVWISHLHADHHLGLARLLAAIDAARGHLPRQTAAPPLLVVGPRGIGSFLDGYAAHVALRYQFRACHEFNGARCAERHWLLSEASGLGLAAALCVPVTHCADSWGLVLTHRSGWRVAYSGDTRPCAALARAASGATLLIHEATFADDLAADALAKRHSTHREAREVARQCGAYRTLLTHLSARYDARDAKGGGAGDAKGNGASDGADAPPSAAVVGSGGTSGEADAQEAARGATHASAALLPALEALCDNADAVVATAADDSAAANASAGAAGATAGAGAPASVAVAFDLMVVNLADLPELPQCTPRLARFLRGAQQRRARDAEAQLEAQRARSRRLEAQAAERLRMRS